ncbi:patatin-like phospholipase family protein [Rhodosalinus sp.]|uniref:patatin-like phospholipase family protein n=1 Tax=Rhodosalinus sp. TaxID=2047741 RepID=UPI00356172D1
MSEGRNRKLGLALGSGGARGWAHIGALRALDEIGVAPDVVAGCSMGAVVGAAWAAGKLDALEDFARGLTRAAFLGYFDLRLRGGGLVQGRAIMHALEAMGLPDRFERLDRPFIAVATDMSTGHEVWLQDGSLLDAVRGSISIPGFFAPHHVDGRWLLDGGVINPVPASACRALGAEVTIAINPNGRDDGRIWSPASEVDGVFDRLGQSGIVAQLPPALREFWRPRDPEPEPPNYFEVVSAAIDILSEYVRETRAESDPPHLALELDLRQITFIEMFRADEAIAAGRDAVMENADAIRQLRDGA